MTRGASFIIRNSLFEIRYFSSENDYRMSFQRHLIELRMRRPEIPFF